MTLWVVPSLCPKCLLLINVYTMSYAGVGWMHFWFPCKERVRYPQSASMRDGTHITSAGELTVWSTRQSVSIASGQSFQIVRAESRRAWVISNARNLMLLERMASWHRGREDSNAPVTCERVFHATKPRVQMPVVFTTTWKSKSLLTLQRERIVYAQHSYKELRRA